MTIVPATRKTLLVAVPVLAALLMSAAGQPAVRVAPMDSVGPRPVEKQTQSSVVRDYLQAWQTLGSALGENRADLLDVLQKRNWPTRFANNRILESRPAIATSRTISRSSFIPPKDSRFNCWTTSSMT